MFWSRNPVNLFLAVALSLNAILGVHNVSKIKVGGVQQTSPSHFPCLNLPAVLNLQGRSKGRCNFPFSIVSLTPLVA